MSLKTKIIGLVDPTIPLDNLWYADMDSKSEALQLKSKQVGDAAPYIRVQNHIFDVNSIERIEIRQTGFLPTIYAVLHDHTGSFATKNFPKTKPILNLYIRSKHDKIKCIRNDYIITRISASMSDSAELASSAKDTTIILYGVLFVPMMYDTNPKSFANRTSFEVLQDLAKYMNLGFASNEDNTNDRMTWIKPLTKKMNFISDVLLRVFKDDKSFYGGFIDIFYHLNLINYGNMFSEELDFDQAVFAMKSALDHQRNAPDPFNPKDDPMNMFLTNWGAASGSDFYISSFYPNTQQGMSLIETGYGRSISYYDQQYSRKPLDNFQLLDIHPIDRTLEPGSAESDDERVKIAGKDPLQTLLDTMAKNTNGEWVGIDYNNGHDNYNYAQIQNERNLDEIQKITITCVSPSVNLSVIRGSRVPLIIVHQGLNKQFEQDASVPALPADMQTSQADGNKTDFFEIDKYLSGFYIINTIKHIYDPTLDGRYSFCTEYELAKKGWIEPPPPMPKPAGANE